VRSGTASASATAAPARVRTRTETLMYFPLGLDGEPNAMRKCNRARELWRDATDPREMPQLDRPSPRALDASGPPLKCQGTVNLRKAWLVVKDHLARRRARRSGGRAREPSASLASVSCAC
jgi:hypothetical protein